MKTVPMLLLAVLTMAGWYVEGSTHDVPEGGYNGHLGTLPPGYGKEHNVPVFSQYANTKEARGCTSMVAVPGSETLLVVRWSGRPDRMTISETFRRIDNETWADDVWVIGTCE